MGRAKVHRFVIFACFFALSSSECAKISKKAEAIAEYIAENDYLCTETLLKSKRIWQQRLLLPRRGGFQKP